MTSFGLPYGFIRIAPKGGELEEQRKLYARLGTKVCSLMVFGKVSVAAATPNLLDQLLNRGLATLDWRYLHTFPNRPAATVQNGPIFRPDALMVGNVTLTLFVVSVKVTVPPGMP